MSFPAAAACVVIAARNASQTIARAVRSALGEPQVAEVIVVDDASADDTAEAALAADDGSGRLRLIVLEHNVGPAAARNRAIERASAPLIAVLDADDFLLRGRFEQLLGRDDWDFVADNPYTGSIGIGAGSRPAFGLGFEAIEDRTATSLS